MSSGDLFTVADSAYSYGTTEVLSALDFSLEPGLFYGLIGPNGSGKSTLIDLLMGIKTASRGAVYYRATPLADYAKAELAKHLALVPQHISTGFDFSVYDVVLMGRHPYIPRFSAPAAADIDIVEEVIYQLDIDHLRHRPFDALSGGERQRVVVARALAQATPTLMLDEATANLDINHTLKIMQVLREKVETQGMTVLAAIHDLNLAAAFCDEFLVLHQGSLYGKGKVEEILDSQMLIDVFSVAGNINHRRRYPKIEFEIGIRQGEY